MNIFTVKKLVTLQAGDKFIPADEYQKNRTKHISEKIEGSKVLKLKAPAAFKIGELLETDKKFSKADSVQYFEQEAQVAPESKPKRKKQAEAE